MIDKKGWQLVLVHMGDKPGSLSGLEELGMGDAAVVADPDCELYRSFGLTKGSFLRMFHPQVWVPGFRALLRGYRVGELAGDGLQMPGMFLVDEGEIVASHISEHAADYGDPERFARR